MRVHGLVYVALRWLRDFDFQTYGCVVPFNRSFNHNRSHLAARTDTDTFSKKGFWEGQGIFLVLKEGQAGNPAYWLKAHDLKQIQLRVKQLMDFGFEPLIADVNLIERDVLEKQEANRSDVAWQNADDSWPISPAQTMEAVRQARFPMHNAESSASASASVASAVVVPDEEPVDYGEPDEDPVEERVEEPIPAPAGYGSLELPGGKLMTWSHSPDNKMAKVLLFVLTGPPDAQKPEEQNALFERLGNACGVAGRPAIIVAIDWEPSAEPWLAKSR